MKKSLLIIALICIVLSSTISGSQTQNPHLSIYYPKEACGDTSYFTYVGFDPDAWIMESWVNSQKCNEKYTFDVGVKNKDNIKVENIRLLIAIPNTTTSLDLAYINVSGGRSGEVQFTLSDFDRTDQNPFTPTMSHGVYPPSGNANWNSSYIIGDLDSNEIINLTITIKLGSNPSNFKVHFDVFNDSNWHNPFSHDSTFVYTTCPPPPVPEFPTIAVPIAAILSFLFAATYLRKH